MIFYVIGIGNKQPVFSEEQKKLIENTTVFSGGKRHLELVKDILPKNYQWIYIKSPMSTIFQEYENTQTNVVIFASGNPLFYGFSNTLQNKYPNAVIHTEPYFSSVQLLANKTNTNSNELIAVSVHGRTWKALDAALIQQKSLIGVLTDSDKNPKAIAERLLQYGFTNYKISIGEDLEGEHEKVQTLTLSEALGYEYHKLNCVLLHRIEKRKQHFGIQEGNFKGLPGRPKMITKMPIRLTTLHLLEILNAKVFWDIGFCTGSIAIEAKLKNPNLEVVAFEKREECEEILYQNQKTFGVPGIQGVIGDFFEEDIETYNQPDTVFIGGHGGRLEELLMKVNKVITSNAIIVMNTVKETSRLSFIESCKNLGWKLTEEINLTLDLHNPICLLKAVKIEGK
ncbi:precorrin-6y C5,15-methyltransferase (decarboxylating) subunit CbiE [uncultured Tenacibaculum sp.]|uniref:precorrin-6y C5,15-methyltransferase (decarboxylating) subunit CbiE n=1 Tax=uncultured Tenacibaculum sp. TaxID=174713 RepID=UPI0026155479|nr:precorrin-6y C5,15-methyltransferase (decarboxylating) subunit CbiE [uncultured Tenacibaculum sp.]